MNRKKPDSFLYVKILLGAMLLCIVLFFALVAFPTGPSEGMSIKRTMFRLQTIMGALEEYREHYGYYPLSDTPTELTLDFLDDPHSWKAMPKYKEVKPSDVLWVGKFGASATDGIYLVDNYDEPYYYQGPGTMNKESYDLWSKGPDLDHGDGGGNDPRKAQTRSENDDITNWKGDILED